jgi:glycosyltransferase involved in cell wall biosynthesis
VTLRGAYYLVSHHNTVVYIDEDSKRLRHAPLGTARLNFLLELSGDRAQLMVTGGFPSERLPASFGRETDEIRVHAGASDLACVIERLPGDEIAIRIGELYVTADWDGVVRNNRNWCREWERFHLASADAARPDETATREREKISGFVIAYNRAAIVETCLRSLRFVDELVVVDKSSTDGTLEIARRYADKVVVVPWTPTADDTRSYAVELCSHDMIVYLDDDECLSPAAIKFILDESANPSAEVYRLPFRSYFLGRFDKRRRDWPEYHERLFRRGALEFSPTIHSNTMVKSSKVLTIPAESPIFVHHLSCASVDQWLEKVMRYTSQPERAGWSHKSIPLSADLVRRQTDYWFGDQEAARDDHVAAYALLRIVYDIVDRLKQWEAEAGIDGDKTFAEICLGLQAEYDQLEQSLGWRGKPDGRGPAGV